MGFVISAFSSETNVLYNYFDTVEFLSSFRKPLWGVNRPFTVFIWIELRENKHTEYNSILNLKMFY